MQNIKIDRIDAIILSGYSCLKIDQAGQYNPVCFFSVFVQKYSTLYENSGKFEIERVIVCEVFC